MRRAIALNGITPDVLHAPSVEHSPAADFSPRGVDAAPMMVKRGDLAAGFHEIALASRGTADALRAMGPALEELVNAFNAGCRFTEVAAVS